MRKLNLELPRFRLELHYKLVKRRKPLIEEPLVPSVKQVKRKYRTGSLMGRFIRYVTSHKSTRRIFAGNLVALAFITTLLPTVKAEDLTQTEESVIEAQNSLVTLKGIQFPVESVEVSQGFTFYHPAIDLRDPKGTPVKPIKEGLVTFADYRTDGYGNLIILDHGKGLESYYAHLSKIEVQEGQQVNTGMEIGQIGTSGYATGAHLHLEILSNGISINPLLVLPR